MHLRRNTRSNPYVGQTSFCKAKRGSAAAAALLGASFPLHVDAGVGPRDRPYIFSNASNDTFFTFSPPSLNNHGTAAFVTGFHPSDSRLRIAGTNGVATTVLDTTGPYDSFGFSPDINDAGQIAIQVGLAGTSDFAMIRTRLGGPTTHIAQTSITGAPGTFDFFFGNPTINAHGQVAFAGARSDSVEGVFVGDGSAQPTVLASNLDGLFDFSEEAVINDGGTVAFYAVNSNNVQGVFTAGPGGIQPVVLGTNQFSFSQPDINNAGTVTFVAYGSTDRIYAGVPGEPLTVVASSGTGSTAYWGFDLPLINDNGDVVFFAELNNFRTGLFDGPDSTQDRIILTGDTLFGSTLEEIFFQLPPMFKALNNEGQVAFSYRLGDGRDGIAIATPALFGDANADGSVNLSDFNILAASFGQSGHNWSGGDFTGDSLVNLSDFNLLAANFGLSAVGPDVTPEDWSALAAAIPEPASIGCGILLAATLLIRRRHARQR